MAAVLGSGVMAAAAMAAPKLVILNEGGKVTPAGTAVVSHWRLGLLSIGGAVAYCEAESPGTLVNSERLFDVMTFPEVIQKEECDAGEVNLGEPKITSASQAKQNLNAGGIASVFFKPALVITTTNLMVPRTCAYATKRVEGKHAGNTVLELSGAAVRVDRASSVTCPAALVLKLSGGTNEKAEVGEVGLLTEVRGG